jgi:hypothetical protein
LNWLYQVIDVLAFSPGSSGILLLFSLKRKRYSG